MVLDTIGALPGPPEGVTLELVDESGYEAWLAIAAEVFLPAEVANAVFPPSLLVSPTCVTVLAGIDGSYVGSATAVHTGDVAGIYSVGTLEQARRRGVGRATTAAVIKLAHERWGVGRIFLQSSAMGLPVYTRLGFRTVTGYQMLAGGLRSD
jgi:N-acetylglutamate synthase